MGVAAGALEEVDLLLGVGLLPLRQSPELLLSHPEQPVELVLREVGLEGGREGEGEGEGEGREGGRGREGREGREGGGEGGREGGERGEGGGREGGREGEGGRGGREGGREGGGGRERERERERERDLSSKFQQPWYTGEILACRGTWYAAVCSSDPHPRQIRIT